MFRFCCIFKKLNCSQVYQTHTVFKKKNAKIKNKIEWLEGNPNFTFALSIDYNPQTENDLKLNVSNVFTTVPNPDMVIIEFPNDKGFSGVENNHYTH